LNAILERKALAFIGDIERFLSVGQPDETTGKTY
jgi:hypothetical protein